MTELCGRPDNFEQLIFDRLADFCMKLTTPRNENLFVHLGDVMFTGGQDWLYKMIGIVLPYARTVLVRGNHDPSFAKCFASGWGFVCDEFSVHSKGRKVLFTHEPVETLPAGVFNVHGHLHNSGHRGELMRDGQHVLVAQEYTDYRPVKLETALKCAPGPVWNKDRFISLNASHK